MGEIQRIDQMTAPPVVGQFYLVPTVRGKWHGVKFKGEIRNWPVIGELHTDLKFFNFELAHYHFDRRFLSLAYLPRSEYTPLTQSYTIGPDFPLGQPVWRRLKCHTAHNSFDYQHKPRVKALQAAFTGRICRRNASGWVCPHRRAPLGSVVPNADGILICPLHGLQIAADTGLVVSASA